MESRPSDFELEVIGFKVLVLSLNRAAPSTSTPTSVFRICRSRGFELEPFRPATNGGVFVLRDGQSHTTFKEGPVLAQSGHSVSQPKSPAPSQRRLAASAGRTTFVSSGVKLVSPASMCPVNRAVTSWNTQPLSSGSLNEAYEA
jgi:hypothetical protein